jgi:hypothetical protein
MPGPAGLAPASRCRVPARSGPRRAMGARAAAPRSGIELRIPAARGKGPYAPKYRRTGRRRASGAGSSQHTADAPEGAVAVLEDHRRRDGSRIACPTVGVAFLLLERHATPADGGPCPDFPRPSLVKQRSLRDAVNTERPTWLMAQVGRLVPLPNPSGGHSLWSATSCLGPCTNRDIAWLLIRDALPISRPGVTDGRERARGRPADSRRSHRRESEIGVRRRHEICQFCRL